MAATYCYFKVLKNASTNALFFNWYTLIVLFVRLAASSLIRYSGVITFYEPVFFCASSDL